jgi:hypothetical protein
MEISKLKGPVLGRRPAALVRLLRHLKVAKDKLYEFDLQSIIWREID